MNIDEIRLACLDRAITASVTESTVNEIIDMAREFEAFVAQPTLERHQGPDLGFKAGLNHSAAGKGL